MKGKVVSAAILHCLGTEDKTGSRAGGCSNGGVEVFNRSCMDGQDQHMRGRGRVGCYGGKAGDV